MILKIERYVEQPTLVARRADENMLTVDGKKTFHMIDHVGDVEFGESCALSSIPDEMERLLDRGAPMKSADSCMVNIIHFMHFGATHRTIVVERNVYLCNDDGDTLEVIRAPHN